MSWSRGRHGAGVPRAVATAMSVLLLLACVAPSGARASVPPPPQVTSPIDFSGSYTIDQQTPFAHAINLLALSCPSSSLCVAIDSAGQILTTTDPTAPVGSWSRFRTDMGNPPDGLACPSASFCIVTGPNAADDGEQAIYSSDPAGGPSAWRAYPLPGGMYGQQLNCPTTNFCAALNGENIYTSTDPAGGAGTWQTSSFSTNGDGGVSLACASASLCVIGSATYPGTVWSSTDPTGGPSAWNQAQVIAAGHISCPTNNLCVASGIYNSAGQVAVSTDPSGGAGAWTIENLGAPTTVTCRATALCVGLQGSGAVVTTHDPSGGASAWSAPSQQLPTSASWRTAASCPADNFCADALAGGAVAASSDPAGAPGSWQSYDVDGYNFPTGVSCPSDGLCVAVDDAGNVLTSMQPEQTGPWSAQHVDSAPLLDVSCLAGPACVAVDQSGGILTSSDPAGGPGAWTRLALDAGHPFLHVSCASGPICVAIDEAGNAFVSADPLGGAGAWRGRQVVDTTNTSDRLTDVSCADRTLCLISAQDELWVLQNPGQADAGWQAITPGAPNEYATPYPSVSCSSASFCAVLSAFGLYWSGNPAGGVGTWSGAEYISSVNPSSLIRCQSSTLCLAINSRALFETASPTVDQSSWGYAFDDEQAPSYYGPLAASCPSAQFCMVVGDAGYGWNGEGPDYVAPSPGSGGGSTGGSTGGGSTGGGSTGGGSTGGGSTGGGSTGGGSTGSGATGSGATGSGSITATMSPPTGPTATAGTAAPSATPLTTAARRAPLPGRIALRTRAARISRGRRMLHLRLACISKGPICAGTIALSGARLRLGRGSYRVAAHRSRTLTIRLDAAAVKLLRRSRRNRAVVTVRLASGGQARTARLILSLLPNRA